MDSLNLLEEKEFRTSRTVRPAWQVGLGALVLPGLGHLLLGKTRLGVLLLLVALAGLGLAAGTMILDVPHVPWLAMRIALLAYVVGVADSVLSAIENRDGRDDEASPPPRRVVFLNLATYGGGYWALGEPKLALAAWCIAAPAHLLVGALGWAAALVAEMLVALAALHGLRLAEDARLPRYIPKLGENRPIVRNSTPPWLVPACLVHAALLVALGVAVLGMGRAWLDASHVDQSSAVSVEPYYRNPLYGVSLEMNAPGWTFTRQGDGDLVVARHVAEDTAVRLSVRPRIPWLGSDEKAIAAELEAAQRQGLHLTLGAVTPWRIGKLDGIHANARGLAHGRARNVAVFTVAKGWRQYVMWVEWGPRHDAFAKAELGYLLSKLRIESAFNARPSGS